MIEKLSIPEISAHRNLSEIQLPSTPAPPDLFKRQLTAGIYCQNPANCILKAVKQDKAAINKTQKQVRQLLELLLP